MSSSIFNMTDTWTLGGGPYTAIKMNATDNDPGTSSLLLDLQVGGASKFKVTKSGNVTAAGIYLSGSSSGSFDVWGGSASTDGAFFVARGMDFSIAAQRGQLQFYSNSVYTASGAGNILFGTYNGSYNSLMAITPSGSLAWFNVNTLDLFLTRADAAKLQLGAADVATGAVPQTLQVQSNTGAATTGPNFTIKGSSGTTAGGSIIFQTHNGTSFGTALTINSARNLLMYQGLFQSDGISGIQPNVGNVFYIDIPASGITVRNNAGSYAQVMTLATSGALTLGPTSAAAVVVPDASNTLALKNAGNAQIFRVYSTTASSGSYGIMSAGVQPDGSTAQADTLYIGSAGTGAAMTKLALVVNGSAALSFNTVNASFGGVVNCPSIQLSGSNWADVSGTKWRVGIAGGFTNGQIFSAGGTLSLDINGTFIGIGGTTSSFPALKRSATGVPLQVRLADDSGDAALQCGTQTSGGTAFNVNGTGGTSIASITNTSTGTLLQVLNSTSNPLMTVTDTTSGTLFSVQSTTAATLFSVNDTTSGTLLAVTNNSSVDVFTVSDTGGALSNSTGGIGYGTGAGGAVTQATSRTTGVTLNKTCGAITLVSAAGSTSYQTFTVTNSTVAATDTVVISQKSGTDLYEVFITAVAAGSFNVTFATTGGTTTEQPVFNFAVIKAVAA